MLQLFVSSSWPSHSSAALAISSGFGDNSFLCRIGGVSCERTQCWELLSATNHNHLTFNWIRYRNFYDGGTWYPFDGKETEGSALMLKTLGFGNSREMFCCCQRHIWPKSNTENWLISQPPLQIRFRSKDLPGLRDLSKSLGKVCRRKKLYYWVLTKTRSPQSLLWPWHGHHRRSASIGADNKHIFLSGLRADDDLAPGRWCPRQETCET